jgi:Uma2 family endonuclease
MATTHDPGPSPPESPAAPALREGPRRIRWTSAEFYRLGELGFFLRRRVELIGGEIMVMTINPPHAIAVELLGDALRAIFGAGFRVRMQQPLDFGRWSQPEPDAAIIAGASRDHVNTHPTSALLVVEVSQTTLRYDRRLKAHRYAWAGIADYWILNLVDRQLEIHRNPGPDPVRAGRYRYADITIIPATGGATPLAAPGVVIAVADLLP